MACPEILHVHAYVDGETDAPESARIERHLQQCESCRALYEELEHMRTAMHQDVKVERAPRALRDRISRSLDSESPGARSAAGGRWRIFNWNRAIAWPVFSALGSAAVAGTIAILLLAPMQAREGLLEDVLNAHVRSLMPAHLIDVESSDHHTVKPWFAGRTDVSPPVADFATQGYRLLGARADYLAHQRAAVLVYSHGRHIINVFSWASDQAELPDHVMRNGFRVTCWKNGTLQSCAIADTGKIELEKLVTLLQQLEASER